MSSKYKPTQFVDPKGIIVNSPSTPLAGIIGRFAGTPTAGIAGYEKGSLAFDTTNGLLYYNSGTITSATWTQLNAGTALATLTATAAELNYLDQDLATNTLTRGAGVDTAESYAAGISHAGGLIYTAIVFDMSTLVGSATDLDIIGESAAANCTWGQITAAKSGTIIGGKVTCLEVPAGGATDIDFYSAAESTGAQDALITSLDEVALVTSGGAWTSGASKGMTLLPRANDYIYVVNGAASGGTFTAGKFLIELYGA